MSQTTKRTLRGLLRIRLSNFRSFRQLDLPLTAGATGIAGITGAGKSNIVEAINVAFLGMPGTQHPKEELRFHDANPSEPTIIELTFQARDGEFRVRREFTAANMTAKASLWLDGKKIAETPSAVTSELIKRVRVIKDLYFASRVCKQNEVRALESKTGPDREKLMLRLLGLEDADNVIKVLRQQFNAKKEELAARRRNLPSEEEILAGRKQAEEELETFIKQLKQEENDKQGLTAELQRARAQLDAQKALQQQLQSLLTQKAAAERRLQQSKDDVGKTEQAVADLDQKAIRAESLQVETASLPAVLAEHQQLANYVQAYKVYAAAAKDRERIKGEIAAIGETIAGLRTEIAGYGPVDEHLASAKAIVADTKGQLGEARQSLLEVREARARLKAAIEHADAHMDVVTALDPNAPCPTCTAPLGDRLEGVKAEAHRAQHAALSALAAYAPVVTAAENGIRNIENALASTEAAERNLQVKLTSRNKAQATLAANDGELERLTGALEEVRVRAQDAKAALPDIGEVNNDRIQRVNAEATRLKGLADELARIEGALGERPKFVQNIQDAKSRQATAEREVMTLGLRMDALGFNQANLDAASQAVKDAQAAIDQLNGRVSDIQLEVGRCREAIRRSELDMEKLLQMEAEVELLAREVRLLQTAIDKAEDFRGYLTNVVRPKLSAWVTELWQDIADTRFDKFEVTPDFDLIVYKAGTKHRVRDVLSGGQRDMAYLCLRLAAAAISGDDQFEFIILDEAFAGVDVEMQARLGRVLQKLKRRWAQIICIFHSQVANDSMDSVVSVKTDLRQSWVELSQGLPASA